MMQIECVTCGAPGDVYIDGECARCTATRADRSARIEAAVRGALSAIELIDRNKATDAGFLLALRIGDALRRALDGDIRSIPADPEWVAVRREDLECALGSCGCKTQLDHRDVHLPAVTRIRAAVAQGRE